MPKQAPATLVRRRCPPSKVFRIVSPHDSEQGFDLELRRLTFMGQTAALEVANQKIAQYIGVGDPSSPDYQEPEPFPPIVEAPVILSPTVCQVVAALEAAQVATDPEERYTFEEIAAYMADDFINAQLTQAWEWSLPRIPKAGENPDPLAGVAPLS